MTVTIDPEFSDKPFAFSFESVNFNHKSVSLKKRKMDPKTFKKLEKVFQVLYKIKLEGLCWKQVLTTDILYRGEQAHPIKKAEGDIGDVIKNAFAENEVDYSQEVNCYPSYLSITKEVRLFGYQWKGIFKVVIVDLDHEVMKRR